MVFETKKAPSAMSQKVEQLLSFSFNAANRGARAEATRHLQAAVDAFEADPPTGTPDARGEATLSLTRAFDAQAGLTLPHQALIHSDSNLLRQCVRAYAVHEKAHKGLVFSEKFS